MIFFQSKAQRQKNNEIKQLTKETIEQLNNRLITINKQFIDKTYDLEQIKENLVDKKMFLDAQHKNDSKLIELTKNIYEEINSKLVISLKEMFTKNNEFISGLYDDINKAYNEFTKQMFDVESRFTKYDLVIETNESLVKKQIELESDIKNMLLIGQKFKDEALQIVETNIESNQTIKRVANLGSKAILDVFNNELSSFNIREKTTFVDAIRSILEHKNIIIQEADIQSKPKVLELGKKEILHETYNKVKNTVLAGVIPMVVGPAGSGKSHAMEQIARDLGLNFYMANRIQNTFELVGFVDAAGKYVTTQFFESFTKGGLFFFDEVDASSPEALVTINAAVAQRHMAFPGHSGNVAMHKDFKAVVAGNTYGTGSTLQYTGRNKLDAATLDRFMVIEWQYDRELEAKKISDKELLEICWTLREIVNKLQKDFNTANKNRDNNPYDAIIISTRGIENLERILIQEKQIKTMTRSELFKSKFFASIKQDFLKNIYNELQLVESIKANKYKKDIEDILKG